MTIEERENKKKIEKLKEQLPERCENCSFLVITDLNNKKVYCPYKIKEKCILK